MHDHTIPIVGENLKARVERFIDQGAVFRFPCGVTGVMNKSYLAWLNRNAGADKRLKIGDEVDVVVLQVSRSKKSGNPYILLGHDKTQENQWEQVEEYHPIGSRDKCRVVEFLPTGAIVEFRSGFWAIIHNTELSWTERNLKASETLSTNNEIDVIVYHHDHQKRRIHASYRQAIPNPWATFLADYPIGTVTSGKVVAVRDFGLFVKLGNGCHSLLHNRLLPSEEFPVKVGDTVSVRIVNFEFEKQRIGLSWPTSEVFLEGREHRVLHQRKERNTKAVARKKEQSLSAHGVLLCEVCDFDFVAVYGPLGEGFAEGHHRLPLTELSEVRLTKLSELAVVCANCHRMLHRSRPMMTVERLRDVVHSRRVNRQDA